MRMRCLAVFASVVLAVSICGAPAFAGGHTPFTYQVTVTSLTGGAANFNHSGEPGGEYFAPVFMMTQDGSIPLFVPGQAPSTALAEVAEAGNPSPLVTLYTGNSDVGDIVTTAPMASGTSTTFTIQGGNRYKYFSMAAMLFPTNDEFMGLSLRKLPLPGHTKVYWVNAWDADSKPDDELCADMAPTPNASQFPVPDCTTSCAPNCIPNPPVPTGAEVHISQGIHGIGDLPADVYDWRNPVAMVTITNLAGEPHRHDH